ncbi:hypothetical protein ACWGTI_30345 [Mesorhizobium sp. ArgA1]
MARRRHPQIHTAPGPCPRQIGIRQRLTLVAVKQNDVAGLGLGFAQLQTQPHALDLVGNLAAFQRVPGSPPAEVFLYGLGQLRPADLDALAHLDLSLEARDRPVGPVGNGASSRGVTTRNAASVFTGGGPGATVAFNASTPPRLKSLHPENHGEHRITDAVCWSN